MKFHCRLGRHEPHDYVAQRESRKSWALERGGFSQENLTPGDGVPAGSVLEGPLMGRAPATLLSFSPKESMFTPWLGVGTGTDSKTPDGPCIKHMAQRHSYGYPPLSPLVSLSINLRK